MSVDRSEAAADLEGLRALDPQVISAIHNHYFPELYRYARYRLGDETLAEDIAGETLARLLESVYAGQGPHTSLRGWLMGTASNLVNDHLRGAYSHPTGTLPEDCEAYPSELSPLQYVENADRQRSVREALGKLTEEQQQVIALRFGNGYSLEETANLMEKKPNAIKALQFRALAALRRVIAEEIL
jgi:RNA polymerase sigma-70 factor (ECF subfamily)